MSFWKCQYAAALPLTLSHALNMSSSCLSDSLVRQRYHLVCVSSFNLLTPIPIAFLLLTKCWSCFIALRRALASVIVSISALTFLCADACGRLVISSLLMVPFAARSVRCACSLAAFCYQLLYLAPINQL